jgi:hypothetical protein
MCTDILMSFPVQFVMFYAFVFFPLRNISGIITFNRPCTGYIYTYMHYENFKCVDVEIVKYLDKISRHCSTLGIILPGPKVH